MGNVDSLNKSPSSINRRSNTSNEPDNNYMSYNDNSNRLNNFSKKNIIKNNETYSSKLSIYEKIRLNRSKKITDLIGDKFQRSNIISKIDSLKIVQISSKITNKILNKNIDYDAINLLNATILPNSKDENNIINKDVQKNLNYNLNSLILSEKFSEGKANEHNKNNNIRNIDKILFNDVIQKNKKIGFYLNTIENKKREELNDLYLSKNIEIDKLIKDKIEIIIKENESSSSYTNSNNNISSDISSNQQIKDNVSGVSSRVSNNKVVKINMKNTSNINKTIDVSKNKKNSNNVKEPNNKINPNESNYNTNNTRSNLQNINENSKNKVLKLDLSKTNLNKFKTNNNNSSILGTTSRSKSPNNRKFELMKNYNKSRVTGFFQNNNRENSNGNNNTEISNWNSPKTSERKFDNNKNSKNVKEVHLKIKINPHNRSPDAKKRDNSNPRNNSNIDNLNIKKKDSENSNYLEENNIKKDINSERNRYNTNLNNKKTEFNMNNHHSPNKSYSRSPKKIDSKYTPLKNKKENQYLQTNIINYKPDKFNPEERIIKTERDRMNISNDNIMINGKNHILLSERNVKNNNNLNYDYRTNAKDISINYGLTDHNENDYNSNIIMGKDKGYFNQKIPETTVKSKLYMIKFLFSNN